MKRFLCLVFVAFIVFDTVYSQTDSVRIYTLEECVEIAFKNNIQLKQNELSVQTADVNTLQAKAARLPSVNGNATQGLNAGRTIDPATNSFIDQQYLSNNFSINANLTLFNGFRISNTISQNQMSREASIYDLKDYRNTLILNLLNAYVQILFNKEQFIIAQNQLSVTQAQVERTEKLVKAGVVPESNLYDLKSKLAGDESTFINADNQLGIAKLNLLQLMNVPISEGIMEQIDVETPQFATDTTVEKDNSESIYKMAEKTQPSIKSAELRLRSSRYSYDAAVGNMYPRLTLSAQLFTIYSSQRTQVKGFQIGPLAPTGAIVNQDPSLLVYEPRVRAEFEKVPFDNQMRDNFAQSVSLNLIVPIYNNRQLRSAAQTASITRKNAELNLENSKLQLRKRIEQAYVDAKLAQKRFEASEAQVKANEEAFRVTEKRFNSGVINSVDYNVSSNTLMQSRSTLLQSKYDMILKKKILEFYKYNDLSY